MPLTDIALSTAKKQDTGFVKRNSISFYPSSICIPSAAAAAAKSLQSCPTLCNPIDGSPPGSDIPEILQARTLKWVAISFSNAWKWKVKVKSFSRVRLLATPWTAAYQAPPSMGFSRQEYCSGVPLPSLAFQVGSFKKNLTFHRDSASIVRAEPRHPYFLMKLLRWP